MNTQTQTFDLTKVNEIISRAQERLRRLLMPEKTVYQFLKENLSIDEFARISNHISVKTASTMCHSAQQALDIAFASFTWSFTMEGRPYWSKLYARLSN